MRYCNRCGVKLLDEEDAKFCPKCGTLVVIGTENQGPSTGLRRIKPGVSRSNRLNGLVIAIIACLIVTSVGALLPVNPYEAKDLLREFQNIDQALSSFGVVLIFGNNLMHSLIMFTPILGPFYGFYVLYSTGRFVAAASSVYGVDPLFLLAFTLAFPHAWLEFISYGIAVSESFWLTLMIARHRFKNELSSTTKAISICALMLLAAAFIEIYLLSL